MPQHGPYLEQFKRALAGLISKTVMLLGPPPEYLLDLATEHSTSQAESERASSGGGHEDHSPGPKPPGTSGSAPFLSDDSVVEKFGIVTFGEGKWQISKDYFTPALAGT